MAKQDIIASSSVVTEVTPSLAMKVQQAREVTRQ